MDDSMREVQQQMWDSLIWPVIRMGIGFTLVVALFSLAWNGVLVPLVRDICRALFQTRPSAHAIRRARGR